MKSIINTQNKAVIAGLMLTLLAACSSTPVADKTGKVTANPGTPAAAVSTGSTTQAADPRGVAQVAAQANDAEAQLKGALAKRSVYFDYDKFDVKPEFDSVIEPMAAIC